MENGGGADGMAELMVSLAASSLLSSVVAAAVVELAGVELLGMDRGMGCRDQNGRVCLLASSEILVKFSELSYFLKILSFKCETVVACRFSFEPDSL